MKSRVFVDTNVWVYAVDDSEPDKQARARQVVAPSPEKDIVVSAQVLGEFYVTTRRRLVEALPELEAQALVDRLRKLPVVAIDGDLVSSAIEKTAAWQISYGDALILAAAETSGCDTVLSEDLSHGRTYGAVRAENPFIDPPEPPG